MTEPTFRDLDSLVDWLTESVAVRLDRDPDDIRTDRPFGEFGMDSVSAAGMIADLEDAVGQPLDMSILWDYPTIDSLAAHLFDIHAATNPG